MIGAGALGRPRGMVWGGRREEGSGWGTHGYLWRIHFDIWQNQYNIVKFFFLKKKKQHSMISSGIWAVSMFLDIISQAKLFSLLKEITFFESKYPDLKSEA